MRTRGLTLLLLAPAAALACGPERAGSLEGFGDDAGESESGTDTGTGTDSETDTDTGDTTGDDGCVDIDLGSEPFAFAADFLDDYDSDFGGFCDLNPGPDYAITWTAPNSSNYQFGLNSELPAALAMLAGEGCEGELNMCAPKDLNQVMSFEATAGQTYTFVVDGEDGGFFEFFIEEQILPPGCPSGEFFEVPTTIPGSTVDGSFEFASVCGGGSSPERSFLFLPQQTGTYRFDTLGSSFDTVLYLFEGQCGGPTVACNDNISDFELSSQLEVDLVAGGLYTVIVDGFGGVQGDFLLNVDFVEAGPSLCDGAQNLGSAAPQVMSWGSEESIDNLFNGCTFTNLERRFIWTAPAAGDYRIAQDAFPLFSGLSVFDGGCEGDSFACEITGLDVEPEVQVAAAAGQEFLIISEWQADGQPVDLSLLIEPIIDPVPGCGTQIDEGPPVVVPGNTNNATSDFQGSCSEGPAPEDELWWTAPATGSYRFSLEGSNYDTLMYIRDGGCDGPELGCSDDTFTMDGLEVWSSLELDLVAGQTVSIFVDGYNGSGTYTLSIDAI